MVLNKFSIFIFFPVNTNNPWRLPSGVVLTAVGSRVLKDKTLFRTFFLVLPLPRYTLQRETQEVRTSKMVQRLTYRKRHSYATKSNQHRVVKTPGNNSSIVNSVKEKRRSKFIGLIVVFVYEMKVGNWCTRPPRKELVDLSVLSLERGFKGYFCFSFFLFSNFSFGLYFCFDFIKKLWKYFMIDMVGWRRSKLFLLEVGILFCYSESNRIMLKYNCTLAIGVLQWLSGWVRKLLWFVVVWEF
jgi:hypothetical protein